MSMAKGFVSGHFPVLIFVITNAVYISTGLTTADRILIYIKRNLYFDLLRHIRTALSARLSTMFTRN